MTNPATGHSASLHRKLTSAFTPLSLDIVNESHLHAGHHESFYGRGETHLRIRIVAPAFAGMSRVARHRAINAVAGEEFAAGLHALAIEANAPGEKA
jgi:BolA protein